MSTTTPTQGELDAQALFEGMFPEGYTPKIDLTRPPVNRVTGQMAPTAAERATWRRAAA